MWNAASAEFASLIRRSHTMAVKVEVFTPWTGNQQLVATSEEDFDLLGGNVTYDRTASTRRTASLAVRGDTSTVPTKTEKLADPLGLYEYKIFRGVVLESTGETEWVPLGTYVIVDTTVSEDDSGGITVDVELRDRSDSISRNKLRAPYNINAGTNYATAIMALITDRASGWTPVFNFEATTYMTPAMTVSVDEDPWEYAMRMAEACGMELYFSRMGVCMLATPADPATRQVAATFRKDADGVRLTPFSRKMSRDSARNGVIVRGSAPWLTFPVSGEAWDDDPLSDTYRYGPMGEVPEIIDDAMVTSSGQAGVAAASKFNIIVGILEEISFAHLVDPRLDEGDVIDLEVPQAGVNAYYVYDTMTIPLTHDEGMSGMTRKRRR